MAVVKIGGVLLIVVEEFEHTLCCWYRVNVQLHFKAGLHLAFQGDDGSIKVAETFGLTKEVKLLYDSLKLRHSFFLLPDIDEKRSYFGINTQGLYFHAIFLKGIPQLGSPVQRLLKVLIHPASIQQHFEHIFLEFDILQHFVIFHQPFSDQDCGVVLYGLNRSGIDYGTQQFRLYIR